jgi:hypothetical protein
MASQSWSLRRIFPFGRPSIFGRVQTATLIFTALALVASSSFANGQDIFGRISGTVTDPSGAAVPGASITVTNQATKATRTLVTDASGFYVASTLPAGIYDVIAQRAGFKSTTQTGNDLVAGARMTVDLRLEVGAVSQTVTVEAVGETVNTTSGEISHTVGGHQVQALALNERNYVQLVSLVPGAALTSFDQTALTTGMSTTASSVNGVRADGNLFSVDGGYNLDSGSNSTQLDNVGIDFIREVALQTSNYSAEYGRNDGASVNVVTKSGGNSFHGGAFEFVRNDMFDAINPASKLNAAPGTPTSRLKPSLRFNDFGWNFGGPIRRNKLFFFAGQEWKRIRISQSPTNLTVPTSAELNGDFSGLLGLATPLLLHAPSNAPAGCTITNNVMSPQCITPDGQAIANVYVAMSKVASAFSNTSTANNATFQPYDPQNWREDIIRIDYNLKSNQSLYFRYLHDDLNLIDGFGTFSGPNGNGTAVLPTDPTNRIRPGYGYQLGYLWTITPHLINEAKFNASWNKQRIPPTGDTWERSTYGFQFPLPFPNAGTYPTGIPYVTFTGIGGAYPTAAPTTFTGPYFSLLAPTTDISPSDNLTWQVRSHTLKFGAMYARNRKDQNSRPQSYNGNINFSINGNPNSTGDPFADALMGNFQTFSQQSADPVGHFRFNEIEGYVDDTWKAARNLSLEFGLRYEHNGPTYTQGNNIINFDPRRFDPTQVPTSISKNNVPTGGLLDEGYVINGLVRAGNVPSDQYVRVPGATSPFVTAVPAVGPRGFYQAANLLAPRVGFAYAPFGDRTAIRAGFGIFYDKPEGNVIFGQPGVVPFLQSVTYQNGNLANPSGGAGAIPTIFALSALDPNFVVARTAQYSLSVQQQLLAGVLLQLAYVGNQGRHEVRQPNINVPTFADALAAGGKSTTNQIRPYLGYSNITEFRSDSNSNYNGLQINVTKRKGDLTAQASYTWSKANGQTSGINDNPEPECPFSCQLASGQVVNWRQFYYGPLSFDRRHIFVISYTYAVPFFRNHGGFLGQTLGGWELSGITRAQSGGPLTILGSQTIGPAGSGVTAFSRRANSVPDIPLYSGLPCPAGKKCDFNPAAFGVGPTSSAGDAGVGTVVGPGYYAWDFSLRKAFKLPREGMSLVFQADAFNAFNRANWGNPGTTVTSGGFGQIGSSNPPRNLQFGGKFAF